VALRAPHCDKTDMLQLPWASAVVDSLVLLRVVSLISRLAHFSEARPTSSTSNSTVIRFSALASLVAFLGELAVHDHTVPFGRLLATFSTASRQMVHFHRRRSQPVAQVAQGLLRRARYWYARQPGGQPRPDPSVSQPEEHPSASRKYTPSETAGSAAAAARSWFARGRH
jgi:hypothetical protein